MVALAPDGRGLHPVGLMHGRVLFEEVVVIDAFGIALHGERPSGKMGQKRGCDPGAVIDDLSFGETGGGIEDLVEIRELELAAFDVDDGGSGHKWTGCDLKSPSSIGFALKKSAGSVAHGRGRV